MKYVLFSVLSLFSACIRPTQEEEINELCLMYAEQLAVDVRTLKEQALKEESIKVSLFLYIESGSNHMVNCMKHYTK